MQQEKLEMTEILAHVYSSESAQQELSNEYQHDRVQIVFKNLCILVLWAKVASASEGLRFFSREPNCIFKSHLQVLCIETSTFLGSLQIFEGAAGEFKGALGSPHPLISSPARVA